MRPEVTLSLSLLLSSLLVSEVLATLPDWQLLPECLRNVGQDLNKNVESFDRCVQTNSQLEEKSLPSYLNKLDETEKNLKLIRQLLDQPSKDIFMGFTGATGPAGRNGNTGSTGASGIPGQPGPKGVSGSNGARGVRGPEGRPGPTGNTGPSAN